MSESKTTGPQNKGLMFVLGGLGCILLLAFVWFFFGIVGLLVSAIAALLGTVVYLFIWANKYILNKSLSDLEHVTFMDLTETACMANLPCPVPLRTTTEHENATVVCSPGDVFGRTILPADDEFYNLVAEKPDNNRVWAFRMRMNHKKWSIFDRKDQYIAIVCQSQISGLSLDATGDIQFNTPILAFGHWAKYGPFYILFNSNKSIAKSQASIDTIKAINALRLSHNRLAEAVQANASTKTDIIDRREARKDTVEVLDE